MKQHRQYRSLPLDSMFPKYVPPPLFTTSVPHCCRNFSISFIFLRVDFKKYRCKYLLIFILMSLMWLHDEPIEISQLYYYIFNLIQIVVFWLPVFFFSIQCCYIRIIYMRTHSPDDLTVFRIFYFISNDHQFGFASPMLNFTWWFMTYFSFVVNKENRNVSSKDIYF
jgi:hypothetical protein